MTDDLDFFSNSLSKGLQVPRAYMAQGMTSQQPTITMRHFPHHRVHPGWWAVDWGNEFFFPKAAIDKWIFDNCSGIWDYCEVTQSRRFFEDEADALLCYMAFKA